MDLGPPISIRALGVQVIPVIRKLVKRCIEIQFDFLTKLRLMDADSGKEIRKILSKDEFVSFAIEERATVKKEKCSDIMRYHCDALPSKPVKNPQTALREILSKDKPVSLAIKERVSALKEKYSDIMDRDALPSKPVKRLQTALPDVSTKKFVSWALEKHARALKEKGLDKKDYNCDALPSKLVKRPQTALREILSNEAALPLEELVSVPKEECSDKMACNSEAPLVPPFKPYKGPQSAYQVYCDMTRYYLAHQNPKLSYKQITQKLKTEWKRLPSDEKEWCKESAARNKARYQIAMEKYPKASVTKNDKNSNLYGLRKVANVKKSSAGDNKGEKLVIQKN